MSVLAFITREILRFLMTATTHNTKVHSEVPTEESKGPLLFRNYASQKERLAAA